MCTRSHIIKKAGKLCCRDLTLEFARKLMISSLVISVLQGCTKGIQRLRWSWQRIHIGGSTNCPSNKQEQCQHNARHEPADSLFCMRWSGRWLDCTLGRSIRDDRLG